LSSIKQEVRQLRNGLLRLEQAIGRFEKIEETANPYDLETLLQNIKTLAEKADTKTLRESISSWLNKKHQEKERLKKDFEAKFAYELETALKDKGFLLKGSYPTLRTKIFTLKLDFRKQAMTIWYGPEQECMGKERLDPKRIARKIESIYNGLSKRTFDERQFLEKVYNAYQRLLRWKGWQQGVKVPIVDVLGELAFLMQGTDFRINPSRDRYRSYSRAHFSYDLYRLSQRSYKDRALELEMATMAMSKSRANYLWIPDNEEGDGHIYSSLSFREVKP